MDITYFLINVYFILMHIFMQNYFLCFIDMEVFHIRYRWRYLMLQTGTIEEKILMNIFHMLDKDGYITFNILI